MNPKPTPVSPKALAFVRKQNKVVSMMPFVRDVPPCPFCGSQPKLLTQKPNDYSLYKVVRCTNEACKIKPSTRFCDTAKEAKDEWSQRA